MVTEFNETDAFTAAFNAKADAGNKFIAIFTGTINPDTNESWCPDCVVAKPHIQRIVDAAAGRIDFIKGIVTRDEWRGNTAHPYRQPPYGAQGVPTIVLYEGRNALYRVDDLEQFTDSDAMDMFLDEM
eukprot:Macronucleus_7890.p1 GENE.Macronucleus_7890~~Macronucleus_7890.p1  ORF type:complete len:128 (+),score=45.41 Macronucleus_7890:1-384(+)